MQVFVKPVVNKKSVVKDFLLTTGLRRIFGLCSLVIREEIVADQLKAGVIHDHTDSSLIDWNFVFIGGNLLSPYV